MSPAAQTPEARTHLTQHFGTRLKEIRNRRDLSRKEFSERFGVTDLDVLEAGVREPRPSDIIALCDGMQVTPNVLLAGLYQRRTVAKRRQPVLH